MYFLGLTLLFVCLPLLELWLLFQVHAAIDILPTLAIVIITGVVGASLARFQGFIIFTNIQRDLAEGRMPAPHLLDGLMVLIAGVLLITPGLITDTVGFLLLIPPARARIKAWVQRWIEKKFVVRAIDVDSAGW